MRGHVNFRESTDASSYLTRDMFCGDWLQGEIRLQQSATVSNLWLSPVYLLRTLSPLVADSLTASDTTERNWTGQFSSVTSPAVGRSSLSLCFRGLSRWRLIRQNRHNVSKRPISCPEQPTFVVGTSDGGRRHVILVFCRHHLTSALRTAISTSSDRSATSLRSISPLSYSCNTALLWVH